MLKIFAAALIALAAAAFFAWRYLPLTKGEHEGVFGSVVTLPDGSRMEAEVADTPASRAQGLSGRDGLEEGKGMLFLFGERASHGFWMKGMRFPIDIVWLDGESVVTVLPDVPYDLLRQLSIRMPKSPADKVLELPAGEAARHGVVEGATLDIQLSGAYDRRD